MMRLNFTIYCLRPQFYKIFKHSSIVIFIINNNEKQPYTVYKKWNFLLDRRKKLPSVITHAYRIGDTM